MPKVKSVTEFKEIRIAIYRALCANHMTHDVAEFLSCLNDRVLRLESEAKTMRKRDAQ